MAKTKILNKDANLTEIEPNAFIDTEEESGSSDRKVDTYEHNLKIQLNQLVKDCLEHNIPIFIAYYSDTEKYIYNGVMPEEIDKPELYHQYGKFDEFLRTCIGFNKEEALKSSIHKIEE